MSSKNQKECAVLTQRLNSLFQEARTRGTSTRSILLQLGMSETALAEWNRGKSKPTIGAVVTLARYFNVSADYLLGLTDERKPLECREVGQVASPAPSVPAVFGDMPDLLSEERFINTAKIYHELPDEMRERAYMLIYGMALGIGLNVDNILRR